MEAEMACQLKQLFTEQNDATMSVSKNKWPFVTFLQYSH